MHLGARRTTREAGWGCKYPFSFLSNSKVVRSFFIVLESDAKVEYQLLKTVEMCLEDLLSGKPRHIAHIHLAAILNTGRFLMLTSK